MDIVSPLLSNLAPYFFLLPLSPHTFSWVPFPEGLYSLLCTGLYQLIYVIFTWCLNNMGLVHKGALVCALALLLPPPSQP